MKYYIFILSMFLLSCKNKARKNYHLIKNIEVHKDKSTDNNESPLLVWSSKMLPNPSISPPAIFYSPHQDDETIGMGASIAEHVRIGRPVFVVLFTNGAGSSAINILNGKEKCYNHNTFHHFNLTQEDIITARNAEFIAACKKLGVHRIYIANNGKGFDESIGLINMTLKFKNLILDFQDQYPTISHKLISGNSDYACTGEKCDVYTRSDAHRAGDIAINELFKSGKVNDIRLYKTYIYSSCYNSRKRNANWLKPISELDMLTKQKACDEYKLFKPKLGRYAIGFEHSVWEYFSNTYSSEFEYVNYPTLKK